MTSGKSLQRALELSCLLSHGKASQATFCFLALPHPSHGWCRDCTNTKYLVKRILLGSQHQGRGTPAFPQNRHNSSRTPHCLQRHIILLRVQHPSSCCQRRKKSHMLRCSLLIRVPGSAVRRGEMRTNRWMLLWWTEGRRLAGLYLDV